MRAGPKAAAGVIGAPIGAPTRAPPKAAAGVIGAPIGAPTRADPKAPAGVIGAPACPKAVAGVRGMPGKAAGVPGPPKAVAGVRGMMLPAPLKRSAGVLGIDPPGSAGVRGIAEPAEKFVGVLGIPGMGAELRDACATGAQLPDELASGHVGVPSSLTFGVSSHHFPLFAALPSEPAPQLLFWL